jgi:hypothetical protein
LIIPLLFSLVVSSILSSSCELPTFPVRFVCFLGEQTNNSTMSSQGTSVNVDVDDEDSGFISSGNVFSPGQSSFASSVTTTFTRTQIKLEEMLSVWDFPLVEKLGSKGDVCTQIWKCGRCGSAFKGWNATKVLNHSMKTTGKTDIKPCSGNISKEVLALLLAFKHKKMGVSTMKQQYSEAFADDILTNQMSMAVALEASRIRSSKSVSVASHFDSANGVAASNATKLTSAIAEFVYCKGLSVSSVEGTHFSQILRLAKHVTTAYCPPTRKVLANELLDLSYDNRMDKFMTCLEMDADVYGLSLFGDSTTVHGMPLMNILASGVHEPSSAVLAILDCMYGILCSSIFFLSNSLYLFI